MFRLEIEAATQDVGGQRSTSSLHISMKTGGVVVVGQDVCRCGLELNFHGPVWSNVT